MDFTDIIEDIVAQIIEVAHNATNVSDGAKLVLDACENEATEAIAQIIGNTNNPTDNEILLNDSKVEASETSITNALDAVGCDVTSDEAMEIPFEAGEDTARESNVDAGASEIVSEIVEIVYEALKAVPDTADEMVVEQAASNELSDNSMLVQLDSDVSLIIEQIDCVSNVQGEIHDGTTIVATTDACFEQYDADETCKTTPAEAISQSTHIEETNNERSVDQGPDGIRVLADTAPKTTMESSATFYSDELLRRKGYSTQLNGNTKRVVNLAMPSNPLRKNSRVHCSGLPAEMTENELIPLFEKAGPVYGLHMSLNCGKLNITYATAHAAENAIKLFDGLKVKNRPIKLENFNRPIKLENFNLKTKLYVSPISFKAHKRELFDQFNKLSRYLCEVTVPSSQQTMGQNRGYCYLEYKDHESALVAMKTITNSNLNGRRVFCDWADLNCGTVRRVGIDEPRRSVRVDEKKSPVGAEKKIRIASDEPKRPVGLDEPKLPVRMDEPKRTVGAESSKLYMNYLGAGIRASDLREIFSEYGEVLDIDKSENWAQVRFRSPEDADVAYLNFDPNVLGNQNVEISRKFLVNKSDRQAAEESFSSPDRREPGDYSSLQAFNRQPIETTFTQHSGYRMGISTANNTAGAVRQESHDRLDNKSPRVVGKSNKSSKRRNIIPTTATEAGGDNPVRV